MLYIAVVPASCADADTPSADSPSDGDRHAQAVGRYFAAIESGDYAGLQELLTPDAVTRWPQSGEQITGATTCARVYENYPGGPPSLRLERVSGARDQRVAELTADYGDARWYVASIFEFEGDRIARITDYFGPTLPAPDWRRQYVDPVDRRDVLVSGYPQER